MVLKMEAMNLGLGKYEEIFYKDYKFMTKVFARYMEAQIMGKLF